ncbi:neurogenic locus notch like protein precursor [Legionella beliardensis]|uniref:Neurogenic locus notch like protein n=1 Tax=Legionella beliardensis TaxID=91822 RepID=A0A378I068_9GAMM|nr:hypothetical protein [Legionella beliardensis]STX28372.1 neurogenic locus notch like protein precursor [Legionella beliardensis]
MQFITRLLTIWVLMACFALAHAGRCGDCQGDDCPKNCRPNKCCAMMGGVSYCDSTAGRLVCKNGYYSSCYCTRHAIMDLQNVQGCCLWQGGVLTMDEQGLVICNNGGISELCSSQSALNHNDCNSYN